MERVEVADTATVSELRAAIQVKLDVPVEKQTLSVNQALLMSKNPAAFTDMLDAKATLKKLGIAHGAMVRRSLTRWTETKSLPPRIERAAPELCVCPPAAQVYLKYDFERTVEPVGKINTVPFGKCTPS
jgi:hypothetical protein